MAAKARRIDYSPDEYIAGVGGVLDAAEQGIYWMICSLIMSEGHAIEQNDRRIAGLCLRRPAEVRKVIDSLVAKGKILRLNDGKLAQKRALNEVEKSLNRISTASENGAKGGRPKGKHQQKQQKPKADGFPDEKLSLTINDQPPTDYSEAKASAQSAPPDFKQALFSEGLASLLRQTSKSEEQVRRLLGKWLKIAGNDPRKVLTKIKQAEADQVADVVAWVQAALTVDEEKAFIWARG
ncbi:MAG: hypothetical protein ACTHJQ_19595 [Rhizobiaceae bacterium]